MQMNRSSIVFWLLALLYLFLQLSSHYNYVDENVSSEAVLGQVGNLPYVTLYSTKSPARPDSPDGWWSLGVDENGKYVALPGRVQTAPARLIYTKRMGAIRCGVVAQEWRFAGILEGFVFSHDIKSNLDILHRHYENSITAWESLTGQKLAPMTSLQNFFELQASQLVSRPHLLHPLGEGISNITSHLEGIVEGFNLRFAPKIEKKKLRPLTLADLLFLNSETEILDIGARITGSTLEFATKPQTKMAKRFGKDASGIAQHMLSSRTFASLVQVATGADDNTDSWPDVRLQWEAQHFFPANLVRSFLRVTITSSDPHFGYQFIGLPGQIISSDSFSVSLGTSAQITVASMRQADYASPRKEKDSKKDIDTNQNGDKSKTFEGFEKSEILISPWMVAAAVFHAPNVTFNRFLSAWNVSKNSLTSENWKFVVAHGGSVLELESHEGVLFPTNLTSHMQKNAFLLSTSTMTRLTGSLLESHGFVKKANLKIDPESKVQVSDFDVYRQDGIARARMSKMFDMGRLLSAGIRSETDYVIRELGSSFDLLFDRQSEYVDLSGSR